MQLLPSFFSFSFSNSSTIPHYVPRHIHSLFVHHGRNKWEVGSLKLTDGRLNLQSMVQVLLY
eukprot:m.21770 g.21770  ORF g.21770 m.21770 type:complete len:62 (+) comp5387_c0_seq1:580-765(+)